MIFKKKKAMSNNSTDNNAQVNENKDNMSQNEAMEEALANELNTDDSGNKGNFIDEGEQEHVDKLEADLQEQKDKYLRLVAEFDNFRRRNAKERIELMQTANKDTVQSLLVVLDDMDRASKQMQGQDIEALKEGVKLVFNKLRNVMTQQGLKQMEVGNAEFNPDIHEAITEIPAPNEKLVGKVIDVVEAGYYLNDKLIRHAKVVVGK